MSCLTRHSIRDVLLRLPLLYVIDTLFIEHRRIQLSLSAFFNFILFELVYFLWRSFILLPNHLLYEGYRLILSLAVLDISRNLHQFSFLHHVSRMCISANLDLDLDYQLQLCDNILQIFSQTFLAYCFHRLLQRGSFPSIWQTSFGYSPWHAYTILFALPIVFRWCLIPNVLLGVFAMIASIGIVNPLGYFAYDIVSEASSSASTGTEACKPTDHRIMELIFWTIRVILLSTHYFILSVSMWVAVQLIISGEPLDLVKHAGVAFLMLADAVSCAFLLILLRGSILMLVSLKYLVAQLSLRTARLLIHAVGGHGAPVIFIGQRTAEMFVSYIYVIDLWGMDVNKRMPQLCLNFCFLSILFIHYVHDSIHTHFIMNRAVRNLSKLDHIRIAAVLIALNIWASFVLLNLSNADWWIYIASFALVVELILKTTATLSHYAILAIELRADPYYEGLDNIVTIRNWIQTAEKRLAFGSKVWIFCGGVYLFFFEYFNFPLFMIIHRRAHAMFLQVWNLRKSFNNKRKLLEILNQLPIATALDITNNDDVCSICHSDLQDARVLPCQHIFHDDCLVELFQRQMTCPVCQTNVLVDHSPPAGPQAPVSMFDQLRAIIGGNLQDIVQEANAQNAADRAPVVA